MMFTRSKPAVETPESVASACYLALDQHRDDVRGLRSALDFIGRSLNDTEAEPFTIYFERGGAFRLRGSVSDKRLSELTNNSHAYLASLNMHAQAFSMCRAKLVKSPQCPQSFSQALNTLDTSRFSEVLTGLGQHVGNRIDEESRRVFSSQLGEYLKPLDSLEISLKEFIDKKEGEARLSLELCQKITRINFALSALVLTGLAGGAALWYSVTQKQSTASVSK